MQSAIRRGRFPTWTGTGEPEEVTDGLVQYQLTR
jgi:hypothetical protein